MERPPSKSVSSLLVSVFSGTTDEYGHDLIPPQPLPFNVVLEGRLAASSAPLLSLPAELLTAIISYLKSANLDNLALVNSDCRQLVRSRRFANIWLNFGPKSMQLIQWLCHEAEERLMHSGITKKPAIGSCVRRILVATHPFFLTTNYGLDYDLLDELDEEQGREEFRRRDERASRVYFNKYTKDIEQVLRTALPHLQLLDWEDRVSIPPSMYSAIARSPVDHLKLYRIPVDKDSELPLDSQFPTAGWPLRTLHLELMPEIFTNIDGSTAKLSAEILKCAAPYLESLVWVSSISRLRNPQTFSYEVYAFPRLLDLEPGSHNFLDESILQSLIPAGSKNKLQTLVINPGHSGICDSFLERRGAIPSLKTLVWQDFGTSPDDGLHFIKANSQLRKLSMPYSNSPRLLENTLLPLLTDAFKNLMSLRLTWEGTSIPESALEAISSISSLEQLCLSAGNQFGWRHDWRINHKTMRKHLSELPNLKKLAFSRDSYLLEAGDLSDESLSQMVEGYYEHKYILNGRNNAEQGLIRGFRQRQMTLLSDLDAQKKVRERLFELIHRRRMLITANHYAYCMEQLEWIYVGQLPMKFTTSWLEFGMGFQGPRRVGMALSDERDDCWTLLNRIFGRDGTVIETLG